LLVSLIANLASFCMLDALSWSVLPGAPSEVASKLAVCIEISMIAMIVVVIVAIVDLFAKEAQLALKGAYVGLGLAVGVSWEKTFDAAVDGLDAFGFNEPRKALISFFLLAIVFPAWMLHMLTKSDPELRKIYQKNPPPLWGVCCDWDPCQEIDEMALLEQDDDFDNDDED